MEKANKTNNNTRVLKMTELLSAIAWWETMDKALENYDPFLIKVAVWAKRYITNTTLSKSQLKTAIEEKQWAVLEDDIIKPIRVYVELN